MAIAAIVLHAHPADLKSLLTLLKAEKNILDCQQAAEDRIALTIETSAATLLQALEKIKSLQGVWNLELVYANYEDDLDQNGSIACPPIAEIKKTMQK